MSEHKQGRNLIHFRIVPVLTLLPTPIILLSVRVSLHKAAPLQSRLRNLPHITRQGEGVQGGMMTGDEETS
ncbi:hypothetical protein E2C01_003651 [Portunus trituberculatus]|uniref:Uncharacterized protein n=1 Tax=Portunus trituberculatus TaxID=210409 RepID=A0A5B7CQB6_PORTR|nr:hypothetical protein [Portunus trituberculatus]